MKKVALIIANKDFRDEEFFVTKETIEKHGIAVDVFSNKKGIALGRFGGEYDVKNSILDLKANAFDGVVIIGGSGALERLDNDVLYDIVVNARNLGKIVAAICISPVILARSGILQGKKATVWSSSLDKAAIDILKSNGAIYLDEPVVIDSNIVTGKDFEASFKFGEAISLLLT